MAPDFAAAVSALLESAVDLITANARLQRDLETARAELDLLRAEAQ